MGVASTASGNNGSHGVCSRQRHWHPWEYKVSFQNPSSIHNRIQGEDWKEEDWEVFKQKTIHRCWRLIGTLNLEGLREISSTLWMANTITLFLSTQCPVNMRRLSLLKPGLLMVSPYQLGITMEEKLTAIVSGTEILEVFVMLYNLLLPNVKGFTLVFLYVYLLISIWGAEWQKIPPHSLPKCPLEAGNQQSMVRSWDLRCEWQRPKYLSHHLLSPRVREQETGWGTELQLELRHSNMRSECPKWCRNRCPQCPLPPLFVVLTVPCFISCLSLNRNLKPVSE